MAINVLLVILLKKQLSRWTVLEDKDLDPWFRGTCLCPDGMDQGGTGRVGTDSEGTRPLKEGTDRVLEMDLVGMDQGGRDREGRVLSMDEVGPRMAEERAVLRVTQGTTETGEAADSTAISRNTDTCCNKVITILIQISKATTLCF